jgi:integrase
VKLAKLSGARVNALYAKLAEEGKAGSTPEKKQGLSPLAIHHVHTCLHKACKDAVRWGRLPKNPVDAADPPSTRGAAKKEMKTWRPGSSRRSSTRPRTTAWHRFGACLP